MADNDGSGTIKKIYDKHINPYDIQTDKGKKIGSATLDWLVFLPIIILHAIDAFGFNFSYTPGIITTRLLIYVVFITIIMLIVKESFHNWTQYLIAISIPAVGYPAIKYALSIMGDSLGYATKIIEILLVTVPPLAIFMYYKGYSYPFSKENKDGSSENGIVSFIRNLFTLKFTHYPRMWIFFFAFIGIIQLILMMGTLIGNVAPENEVDLNTGNILSNTGELLTTTFERISDAFFAGNVALNGTMNKLWAQTLGTQYSGQVEENTERTGVFIKNFGRTGKFYENIPIVFFPNIQARSFSDKPINMEFRCIAIPSSSKEKTIEGYVEPKTLVIENYDDQGVQCQFNKAGEPNTFLKPGAYRIEFLADFNFETWAYTTYVFMERDFLNSLRTNGEDVNRKFDIPKKPVKTIYTAGPAMIGMNQEISLPVSLQTGIGTETNIPIGITLSNKQGTKGEIKNVDSFQIRVPQEFKLSSNTCTRALAGEVAEIDPETNYAVYTFQNPNSAELTQAFLTVDCNMKISGSDATNIIPEAGGVTGATIVGSATYNYQLKESVSIRVEKNEVQ